jgi:hypothetical protein
MDGRQAPSAIWRGVERERLGQRWREIDKDLDNYAARRPRDGRRRARAARRCRMSLGCASVLTPKRRQDAKGTQEETQKSLQNATLVA